jgi:hypothetical protein
MNGEDAGAGMMGGGIAMLFVLAFMAVMVASMWKVFAKAGQPGWASLVPIYNLVVLLKIVGKPTWWLVLFLVPFVNFFALIMVALDLAKCFGKSKGFGLGLVFLGVVFYPLLAFGDAQYQGPAGESGPVLSPAHS